MMRSPRGQELSMFKTLKNQRQNWRLLGTQESLLACWSRIDLRMRISRATSRGLQRSRTVGLNSLWTSYKARCQQTGVDRKEHLQTIRLLSTAQLLHQSSVLKKGKKLSSMRVIASSKKIREQTCMKRDHNTSTRVFSSLNRVRQGCFTSHQSQLNSSNRTRQNYLNRPKLRS